MEYLVAIAFVAFLWFTRNSAAQKKDEVNNEIFNDPFSGRMVHNEMDALGCFNSSNDDL